MNVKSSEFQNFSLQATSRTTKSATPHLFLFIFHCVCHHINSMGLYRSVRQDEQSGGRKCRETKWGETSTCIFPSIKQRENKITTKERKDRTIHSFVFFYYAIPKYIFVGWL